LVAALYWVSNTTKQSENGFIRLLPSHLLVPGDTKNLQFNSYYIAGLTKDSIYLGNRSNPYIVKSVSYDLKKETVRACNWGDTVKISRASVISVDSPYINLNDGVLGRRMELSFSNKRVDLPLRTAPFTDLINLDKSTMIYRAIISVRGNVIVKQKETFQSAKVDTSLLIKQGEGIFSTDGMLIKSQAKNNLFYFYYYRNQFFCLDTNLAVKYRGKTIDTISHAHITVAPIKSEGKITMSSPPLIVNRAACANNNYIFVNSALTANNEPANVTGYAQIIDVYNIKTGKYKFSFYLPKLGGKKTSDFKVYQNRLVAIYDRYLTIYKLNFN